MNNPLVTQFGAPDAPYCDPATASLNYQDRDHATALKATGETGREVLQRGQLPFTLGGLSMKKIIIIGCGPKAIAIATKAHVLKKLGWSVPEIIILDKYGPAANWDGTNGYTDGELILGTPPLEDVGFPYASIIDPSVDEEMLKFSYFAYQIDIHKYAEWINRTLQAPTHGMLAGYLKWLVKKIEIPHITGEVISISSKEDKWIVMYKNTSGVKEIVGEGLVVTGPGDPYQFPRRGISQEETEKKVLNAQDIWHNMKRFKEIKNAKIAVIGAGETAAAVVTRLLKTIDESSQIEIITRHPMLFTRNQNWMEVMYFSKAMNWSLLSQQARMEIIRHADRGTFSPGVKNLLDSVYNVSLRIGNVEKIEITSDNVYIVISGNSEEQKVEFDYIIEATGFNPFSVTKLFSDKSFFMNQQLLPEKIDTDLSVKGISPKLHWPGLAALAQGPGFPNLSCLGLLSERILTSYIDK